MGKPRPLARQQSLPCLGATEYMLTADLTLPDPMQHVPERRVEALRHGVVAAIAASVHRALKIVGLYEGSPVNNGEE